MARHARMTVRIATIATIVALSPVGATPARAAASTRLLVVGDSITQGSAGDYTWRYRLAKHLSAAAPGTVDFVGDRTDLYDNVAGVQGSQAYVDDNFDRQHHALWGRPVAYEKDTIADAVRNSNATVMTVLLGINDLAWLGQTPSGLAADMEQLIANARSANPGLDIVLGHILTRGDLWGRRVLDQAVVSEVNQRYDALAQRLSTSGSRIVTASTEAGWDPLKHTWDGVHPNSTGEVIIAAGFADGLSRLGVGRAYGAVPDFVKWDVAGGAMSATSLDGGVALRWTATPGANAIYVEQRIVSLGETTFTPLPVPLSGTTWTAKPLVPGWVIEYRAVPIKGLMVGHGGPSVRVTVGGTRPTNQPILVGTPAVDEGAATLRWSAVSNATGYYIEMCDLQQACPASSSRWTRLPWPVADTTFSPGLLTKGHWYSFRVVPVNGTLEGPRSEPIEIRTKGVPFYTNYYAMGDSFSAGSGAGHYVDLTCLRGLEAWPLKITASWEPRAEITACAGKTTSHVLGTQLQQVTDDHPTGPTLVTITIGGNDIGFAHAMMTCAGWTDCTELRNDISLRIANLQDDLVEVYKAIRRNLPGADILAVGYPLLIDPDDLCFGLSELALSRNDKQIIHDLGIQLNDVINRAAQQAGVTSVAYEPTSRFAGHGACAGPVDQEAWINAYDPDVFVSFHPNPAGQQAYAYAVNDARVNLNQHGMVRRQL